MTILTQRFTISKTVTDFIDNSTVSKAPLVRTISGIKSEFIDCSPDSKQSTIENKRRKYLSFWVSREKNENGYYLIKRLWDNKGTFYELYTDGSVLEMNEENNEIINKWNVDIDKLEDAVREYRTKLDSNALDEIIITSKNNLDK